MEFALRLLLLLGAVAAATWTPSSAHAIDHSE